MDGVYPAPDLHHSDIQLGLHSISTYYNHTFIWPQRNIWENTADKEDKLKISVGEDANSL